MEPAAPEFVPDPSLDRQAMQQLQREIASTARFEDAFGFDPAELSLSGALSLDDVAVADADRGRSLDTSQQRLVDTGPESPNGTDHRTRPDSGRGTDPARPDSPIVVGVDQAFLEDRAISAIVAIRDGEVVERAHAVSSLSIPYIPGLLAFREGAPILEAFEKLAVEPDLALFDGSGRIHFRQAGIATHIGVTLELPSVGVAKSLLCGEPASDPEGRPAGWRSPIRADSRVNASSDTVLGYAYQSRQWADNPVINPLYVSPGHRVETRTAVDVVERLCGGYKLPEPIRLADAYADELKRSIE